MDMKAFLSVVDRQAAEHVAQKAGTSYLYLVQLAGGHRKPSLKLALKLIDVDKRLSLAALRPDIYEAVQPRIRRRAKAAQ